jgi:glucose-1-phosphate thymidylyltransferase
VKALVLAGGSGTRLRPITYTSAKQLVPLANRPILFYGLETLAAVGVTEVGIVVGDTHQEIRDAIGDGSALGLSVTYLRQEAPLGLAHAVLIARDFLGDEPFVMYLGDNLIVGGIADFVEEFVNEPSSALVLLTPVDDPRQFGVAELAADGSLVRLVEKPQDPPSNLALVGVYLFGPEVHEAVRAIAPSARGELEITDALQWLLDNRGPVRAHVLARPWIDTGKLTDLLEANQVVLDQQTGRNRGVVDAASVVDASVVVEAGARVERSLIAGPSIIGAGTVITDARIGPHTSIGPDCQVHGAEIANSVVLEGAVITGRVSVADSLVGKRARIAAAPTDADASPGVSMPKLRMHVGDHSDVEIG